MKRFSALLVTCLLFSIQSIAATDSAALIESLAKNVQPQVVKWRRHFHQHPELSNEEFNTAKTKGNYRGKEVGVMHACGHYAHMAILLGIAKSLSDIKNDLAGNVLFIFQPAEEGLPAGEVDGAELMLKEGLFKKHKPDVVYGLHIWSSLNAGTVSYRSGPAMASADVFEIVITGKQTHGSRPWGGVDPIVVAAQTIMAVQTSASRQVNVTKAPSIISFGMIEGGIRNNIIPQSVKLVGTIRNFDMDIRAQIHQKIKHTAKHVALAAGATPKGVDAKTAPSNHSPYFDVEESVMQVGVQTLLQSTLDYMARH